MTMADYRKWLLLTLAGTVAIACESDYDIWIPRDQSADALFRFVRDGKAGYIDAHGRVLISPSIASYGNSGGEFHDGLMKVGLGDVRYVDKSGKVVIQGIRSGDDFSEGLAVAMKKDQKLWGYIDTSGKFAIAPRFPSYPDGEAYSFSEGLARIDIQGRTGYIDHSGEFVIQPRLLEGRDFQEGFARVVTEGPCAYLSEQACQLIVSLGKDLKGEAGYCKFTFIDKTGRIITEQRFDYAREFSEGLAAVKIGMVWGFIDTSGTVVIPPAFDYAGAFSSGLAPVVLNGAFGYIDKLGHLAVLPQFEYAGDFSDGLAVVGDGDDHYWYIDRTGRPAFHEEFETASPFFKGFAHVELISKDDVDRYAYIDRTGRHVFTYEGPR